MNSIISFGNNHLPILPRVSQKISKSNIGDDLDRYLQKWMIKGFYRKNLLD